MSIDSEEDAKRKCTHEIKALFHRWEEESDLDSQEILDCVSEAIDEYYDEEVVEFDSEIDLDEEED
jgi:O6-methylguanine-DNA--protein-cysteine methyltransferase